MSMVIIGSILISTAIIILGVGVRRFYNEWKKGIKALTDRVATAEEMTEVLFFLKEGKKYRVSLDSTSDGLLVEWVYNNKMCRAKIAIRPLSFMYHKEKGDYIEIYESPWGYSSVVGEPTIKRVYTTCKDELFQVPLDLYSDKYYPKETKEAGETEEATEVTEE